MGNRRRKVRVLAMIAAVAVFSVACGGTIDTETAGTAAEEGSDLAAREATTTTDRDTTTTSAREATTSTSSVSTTSTTSPAVTVTVTRPVTVPPPPVSGGGGLPSSPPPGSSWCELNRFLDDQGDFGLDFDAVPDPAAVEAAFTSIEDLIDTWAAAAPPEIQADAALLVAGFGELVDLLEQYDWDFFALASSPDPAVLEVLEGQAFTDASDRIEAYADAAC